MEPDRPLENQRHERFCQLYAGECFGFASRAYKQAGFKPRTDAAARAESSRLLSKDNVFARVRHLREACMTRLAIDAAQILENRLQIANDCKCKPADRLTALRDIERSLGLEAPTKVAMAMTGGTVLVIE